MAISYAHRLGQIIGESLENALEPFLRDFAETHGLYFDKKEFRAARSGTKMKWIDINNNKHDLDFVFEKDGTPEHTGKPVAFIECAWRRYTKHSRNKAQEIQGAIMPLFCKILFGCVFFKIDIYSHDTKSIYNHFVREIENGESQ